MITDADKELCEYVGRKMAQQDLMMILSIGSRAPSKSVDVVSAIVATHVELACKMLASTRDKTGAKQLLTEMIDGYLNTLLPDPPPRQAPEK